MKTGSPQYLQRGRGSTESLSPSVTGRHTRSAQPPEVTSLLRKQALLCAAVCSRDGDAAESDTTVNHTPNLSPACDTDLMVCPRSPTATNSWGRAPLHHHHDAEFALCLCLFFFLLLTLHKFVFDPAMFLFCFFNSTCDWAGGRFYPGLSPVHLDFVCSHKYQRMGRSDWLKTW